MDAEETLELLQEIYEVLIQHPDWDSTAYACDLLMLSQAIIHEGTHILHEEIDVFIDLLQDEFEASNKVWEFVDIET